MEQKTVSGKIPAELHARFRRFTCSLTIAYQHGRYVPAHTSDIGKSARTCGQRRTDERCEPSSAQSDTFCP